MGSGKCKVFEKRSGGKFEETVMKRQKKFLNSYMLGEEVFWHLRKELFLVGLAAWPVLFSDLARYCYYVVPDFRG